MSEQQAAAGRAVEAFNAGDLDGYMQLYDPSVVLHGYAPESIGFEEAKEFYGALLAAFPGGKLGIDDVVQEGEKLAVRFTLTGTHRGELMGIKPTGSDIVLTGQTILRFRGTKVVERWQTADMLGLMAQLGAVPAPA